VVSLGVDVTADDVFVRAAWPAVQAVRPTAAGTAAAIIRPRSAAT
jgi:hypothetical protein